MNQDPITNCKAWQETVLRRELKNHAITLSKFAGRLKEGKDFPNETPKLFATLIEKTSELIAQRIDHTPTRLLNQLNFLICELGRVLRFVERSRIANTPWSMIESMENFLQGCAGENAHFLIRPQWSYNYGISSVDLVAAITSKLRVLKGVSIDNWGESAKVAQRDEQSGMVQWSKIYCVSFPRLERNNALLHAALGHEIGHVICQKVVDKEFNAVWTKLEAQIKETFRLEIESSLPSPKEGDLFRDIHIDQRVSKRTELVEAISRKAFDELTSDLVGVWLFGPAAFGSLSEIASRSDLDASPLKCQNYPPWRYRLRLASERLLEDISQFEQTGAIEPTLSPLLNWLNSVISTFTVKTDMTEINAHAVTREAYRIVNDQKQTLLNLVPSAMPSSLSIAYSLFQRREIVVQLVEKLDRNIPPNEYGVWPDTKYAQLADILNAGWAFKYFKIAQNPDWATSDNVQKLYRLILKAIEASSVHEIYGSKLTAIETAES